jgi:MerR family transcriptional regulator, copper efflux regulator
MPTTRRLQIGEVAELVKLSLRTLRHWDDAGVVTPSGRSAGGFRLYTTDDVDRLIFARSLKPLNFSLEEMRAVIELRTLARQGELDEAGRDRLAMYAEAAEQRCEILRTQLEEAGHVATDLRQVLSA